MGPTLIFLIVIGLLVLSWAGSTSASRPTDISPWWASLFTGFREPGYKPRHAITVTTPSGVRTEVRCPHRHGHRSPDLALDCQQNEAARIRRAGR
jgi:hypothetical protein